MERYGIDHPDLRFDLPLRTVPPRSARQGSFKVFHDALEKRRHGEGAARAGPGAARRAESWTS